MTIAPRIMAPRARGRCRPTEVVGIDRLDRLAHGEAQLDQNQPDPVQGVKGEGGEDEILAQVKNGPLTGLMDRSQALRPEGPARGHEDVRHEIEPGAPVRSPGAGCRGIARSPSGRPPSHPVIPRRLGWP